MLWKGALAIGVGKLAAMAIVASTFNSDITQTMFSTLYTMTHLKSTYSLCVNGMEEAIYIFIFIFIIIHDIMYLYICNKK